METISQNKTISEDFVLNRIDELCRKYNMSRYRLSMKSSVDQATLSMLFNKKTVPTVYTIDKICNAFGITIAQFFSVNGEHTILTREQNHFIINCRSLNTTNKKVLTNYMGNLLSTPQQEQI